MSDAVETQTILIIVNLIITAVVAVVTTMRCRAKCGDNRMCTCRPRDSKASPHSDEPDRPSPSSDASSPGSAGQLPSDAVAVVIQPHK